MKTKKENKLLTERILKLEFKIKKMKGERKAIIKDIEKFHREVAEETTAELMQVIRAEQKENQILNQAIKSCESALRFKDNVITYLETRGEIK